MNTDNSKFKIQNSKLGSHKLPIYLFSKTSHPDVNFIPVLATEFFQPDVDFSRYDAIVLTSKQAVTALDKISGAWTHIPALTIADLTAAMARKSGATVMEKGDGYGDSLAEIIINGYPDKRWLYPRPEVVASDFGDKVRHAGVDLDDVVVYKTSCNAEAGEIELEDNAVLIFTSPFTIDCFLHFYEFKPGHKVVAIGKTTNGALPKSVKAVMPETPSVENCVSLAKQLAD
ncbi:MAG: uroporphyrinogen-III synthase [Campylobacterota bacterium]|nr:uroporphyrinogen-III synthase [Campylobacterota bacterium]